MSVVAREDARAATDTRARAPGLVRSACGWLASILLVVFTGATIAALCARSFWLGELIANLRWQLGEAALTLAVVSWVLRARKRALCAAVLGVFHVAPALMLWWPAQADERDAAPNPDATELCVASFNLLYSNTDAAALRGWLEADRPDVVVFSEVSDFWADALAALSDLYPHQIVLRPPDRDERARRLRASLEHESHEVISPYNVNWGSAMIARHPLVQRALLELPLGAETTIVADLVLGDARVNVVSVHPERAGEAWRIARRNAQLEYFVQHVWWTARTIVCSDLNATLYSPAFTDLVAGSGLRDTRQGFGRLPTWNPPYGLPGQWLDLDHILVGRDFAVLDRRVGPDINSDHLPAIARLRLR